MTTRAPDREAMWQDLSRLLERAVNAPDREGLLDECLDTLVEQFDAARALVLQVAPGGGVAVLAARGPERDLSIAEREEISKSIIRRAVNTGELVVWRPDLQGATASMQALTITLALVAPLRGVAWREGTGAGGAERDPGDPLGVLYLDFRDFDKQADAAAMELFHAAAHLVSVVLELSQRLQLAREDLRVARVRAGGDDGGGMPPLDELLWPPSMAALRAEIESALDGDSSILVLGESGTGKTAVARAIAEASGRQPIVRATLGASDDLNTITSELFGHERGAFSGAMARRVGVVELADGGTLILDEILNLPKHAQQLLLDFAQFGTYRPLGHESAQPKRVRTRLIAATNGDLDAAVKDGRFRLDLYYRLAQVVVPIPPLRARREEIPLLVENHLRRLDPGRDWNLSVALRRLLVSPHLPWPGNVRQLEAVIRRARERAVARDREASILGTEHVEPRDLGLHTIPSDDSATPAEPKRPPLPAGADLGARWRQLQEDRGALESTEREIVEAALTRYGGVVTRAARELGVPRSTLISQIRTLGIETKLS